MEKTASAATAPPRAIARSRSRNRNANPSRARTGSSAAGAGCRRARRTSAVTPTTTNESALIASASRSSPAAPSAPPTSGPAVKPSERTVSISPLARATSYCLGQRPRHRSLGCGRHERELRRLADRDAEPEQCHQRQDRPQLVGARDHRRHHDRLGERDDDQHHAVLEAVDDRAREPGGEDDRAPQREHERRDRKRGAGGLLHVQDQREDGHEVAEGGEAGGACEEAEVAGHGGDDPRRPFAYRSRSVNVAHMPCTKFAGARQLAPCSRSDSPEGSRSARTAKRSRRRPPAAPAPCSPTSRCTPARTPAPSSPRASGPTCSTSRPAPACAPR